MALSDHIKKDTPTNNFATWNSLMPITTPLYDGALQSYGQTSGARSAFSTIQIPTTGKWYIEILLTNAFPNTIFPQCGIGKITATGSGSSAGLYGYYENGTNDAPYALYDGASQSAASSPGSATISSGFNTTSGNITRIYIDADNNQIWFGNNTNWATSDNNLGSTPTFGTSGVFNNSLDLSDGYFVFVSNGNGTDRWFLNAGQDPTFGGNKTDSAALNPQTNDANGDPTNGAFYYTPPAGAKALCTANLEDITPDVDDDVPADYMRPVVISGTNADNNNVSVGFQPDLCWLKNRNGASGHMIVDSVRGAGYALQSDNTGQEGTYNIANDFKEFTSTGFNLGAVSAYGSSNPSGTNNIIAWCWKAAGSPVNDGDANIINENGTQADTTCAALASAATSAGASNVITPCKVSANRKSGFSIIKYEGNSPTSNESYTSTLPHGLSKTPEFFIIKGLSGSGTTGTGGSFNMTSGAGWLVYHVSTGLQYSKLESTSASASSTNIFKGVGSSYITIGVDSWLNCEGVSYIMYAFTSIPGYSAFGSYTGVASGNPFIYLGFKPAFVMIKGVDNNGYTSYQSWSIFDASRNEYNPANTPLYANAAYVEGVDGSGSATVGGIDILSNGFRILDGSATYNGIDNIKHIYAAFAEQPIKYATAR